MKYLENERETLDQIAAYLSEQALEPAQKEAKELLAQAQEKADAIVLEAEQEAQKRLEQTQEAIRKERAVFETSLRQAADQVIETLRQTLQENVFETHLEKMLDQELNEPSVVSRLVHSMVEAVQKEGLSFDMKAYVSSHVSAEQVAQGLAHETLSALQEGKIDVGELLSGVRLRLLDKQLAFEVTGDSLKELLASYLRTELRAILFKPASV